VIDSHAFCGKARGEKVTGERHASARAGRPFIVLNQFPNGPGPTGQVISDGRDHASIIAGAFDLTSKRHGASGGVAPPPETPPIGPRGEERVRAIRRHDGPVGRAPRMVRLSAQRAVA
jgi:hypothetical protein